MKDRLIVALDMKGLDAIFSLIDNLDREAIWYKVGAVNFTRYSYKLIEYLHNKQKKIFIDLKYHDIPNTVNQAVYAASELGVDMLTIHAVGGVDMMIAANDAIKAFEDKYSKNGPLVLAVTVLTSSTKDTIQRDLFLDIDVEDMVLKLAQNAQLSGIRGLVASPKEVKLLKKEFGDYFTIVTPGIRPKDSSNDDQKRVTTPCEAIKMGSDYIVVGRPIYASSTPIDSFRKIITDMEDVC